MTYTVRDRRLPTPRQMGLSREARAEADNIESIAGDSEAGAWSLGLVPESRLLIQRAMRERTGLWDELLPPEKRRLHVFRKKPDKNRRGHNIGS